jgi:hypothetical protein
MLPSANSVLFAARTRVRTNCSRPAIVAINAKNEDAFESLLAAYVFTHRALAYDLNADICCEVPQVMSQSSVVLPER